MVCVCGVGGDNPRDSRERREKDEKEGSTPVSKGPSLVLDTRLMRV